MGFLVCCVPFFNNLFHAKNVVCTWSSVSKSTLFFIFVLFFYKVLSILLHAIISVNLENAYTISLTLNMTKDINDKYFISWRSFFRFGFQPWNIANIATHTTYWTPSHLHEIVNPEHTQLRNKKLLFHDCELSSTKSIILSHFGSRTEAPSSDKCNVHLRLPRNLKKSFTKPRRLTQMWH
jgi:hypothetical protein